MKAMKAIAVMAIFVGLSTSASAAEFATRDEAQAMVVKAVAYVQAQGAEKSRLRGQWDELFKIIHSEKLGEMATEFDRVHSVQRALEVGALNCIVPPERLRPYLIEAVERGIKREELGQPQVLETKAA